MTDELKPCPFCGNADVYVSSVLGISYWVKCENCKVTIEACREFEEAVAAWNKRKGEGSK